MAGPILVVSPHLDDAVLSLGARIASWRDDGERVVIASVFSSAPPLAEVAPAMRKWADYEARCAEDDAACRVLGVEVHRLGLVERAFRRPFLDDWSFFTTPADRTGFTALADITRALEPLAALEPAAIYVPFGIGNHIDHVEVAVAASDWAIAHGWIERVFAYEDFYALANPIRRRHFAAHHLGEHAGWRSPLVRARRLRSILRRIASRIRGPGIETFLDPRLAAADWTSMVFVRTEPAHLRAKLAAIACYASQTRAFGGFAGIERAVRAFHRIYSSEPLYWPDMAPP